MGLLALPSERRLTLKEELESLTTERLKYELSSLLGLTAQNLLRLAMVVAVLEDRGEDLSAIKGGFLDLLRKIACGELLPDLVIFFASQPEKLRKASGLPTEQQQEIVNGRKSIPDRARKPASPREPTEAELEALIAQQKQALPAWWNKESVREMGAVGSPKDVGETAAEMVMACQSPKEAAAHLMAALRATGLVQ